jgi:stalled ribosome rescue protein Dom34
MDKESLMKKQIGLWIDRREAIIVILTDGEEEIRHVPSVSEKYTLSSGSSHARTPEGLTGVTVEEQRDRKYVNQLNKYYDEVIAVIRGADAIQIFGPGEAKRELEKRIARNGLKTHIPPIEATDKMTDVQISAKVRQHFVIPSVPATIGTNQAEMN